MVLSEVVSSANYPCSDFSPRSTVRQKKLDMPKRCGLQHTWRSTIDQLMGLQTKCCVVLQSHLQYPELTSSTFQRRIPPLGSESFMLPSVVDGQDEPSKPSSRTFFRTTRPRCMTKFSPLRMLSRQASTSDWSMVTGSRFKGQDLNWMQF